jgi:hypothetical protein
VIIMRWLAVLTALFISAPAFAGDLYTFKIDYGASVETGKVFAAGTSYRVELDPKDGELPLYPVEVSTDGGEHETAIDPARRFYYSLKHEANPTSGLFTLFPIRPLSQTVTNVQFAVVEEPAPEPVSGLKTREYEIRLSYDTKVQISKSETVPGKVSLRARYWMAEDREVAVPVSLRPALRSGIPEIDSRLTGVLAKLRGLPVKQEVTITAESPGNEPQKSVVTQTIRDLHTAAIKPGQFMVPKGFRYHEPVMSRPGLPADLPGLGGPVKVETPPPGD